MKRPETTNPGAWHRRCLWRHMATLPGCVQVIQWGLRLSEAWYATCVSSSKTNACQSRAYLCTFLTPDWPEMQGKVQVRSQGATPPPRGLDHGDGDGGASAGLAGAAVCGQGHRPSRPGRAGPPARSQGDTDPEKLTAREQLDWEEKGVSRLCGFALICKPSDSVG